MSEQTPRRWASNFKIRRSLAPRSDVDVEDRSPRRAATGALASVAKYQF